LIDLRYIRYGPYRFDCGSLDDRSHIYVHTHPLTITGTSALSPP